MSSSTQDTTTKQIRTAAPEGDTSKTALARKPGLLVSEIHPAEILAEPLRRLLKILRLSVLGGLALIFCAGFCPLGFHLPEGVIIAIVAGISAQYIVSAIPALSGGISEITRAWFDYRSRTTSSR